MPLDKMHILCLKALNLKERFQTVVLGEEMTAGKPDPAPYQFCLKQLNIQPSEAIVFEDSPSGIRSAIGAGIDTIGVASTHAPDSLKQLGVSLVIDDFNNLEMWAKIRN
jgi:beta-phosphoglucomutase-like phosphatase (HAD superfamily)